MNEVTNKLLKEYSAKECYDVFKQLLLTLASTNNESNVDFFYRYKCADILMILTEEFKELSKED